MLCNIQILSPLLYHLTIAQIELLRRCKNNFVNSEILSILAVKYRLSQVTCYNDYYHKVNKMPDFIAAIQDDNVVECAIYKHSGDKITRLHPLFLMLAAYNNSTQVFKLILPWFQKDLSIIKNTILLRQYLKDFIWPILESNNVIIYKEFFTNINDIVHILYCAGVDSYDTLEKTLQISYIHGLMTDDFSAHDVIKQYIKPNLFTNLSELWEVCVNVGNISFAIWLVKNNKINRDTSSYMQSTNEIIEMYMEGAITAEEALIYENKIKMDQENHIIKLLLTNDYHIIY